MQWLRNSEVEVKVLSSAVVKVLSSVVVKLVV